MTAGGSILIADEQPLSRGGLVMILQQDLAINKITDVASFDSIIGALARNPDFGLAVIDMELPGLSGSEGVRYLRLHYPRLRLAAVSATVTREAVLELLSAGVHGYIPKYLPSAEMKAAFKVIIDGQIYVPPLLSEISDDKETNQQLGQSAPHALTQRQHEVLRLMVGGYSNKQIARSLNIAEGTVKVHINAAFRILGVHNRVTAVRALRELEAHAPAREPPIPGLLSPTRRASDSARA